MTKVYRTKQFYLEIPQCWRVFLSDLDHLAAEYAVLVFHVAD